MFRVRYTAWHDDATTAEDAVARLLELFRVVLLKVDMDVDDALRIIELLDERYGVYPRVPR